MERVLLILLVLAVLAVVLLPEWIRPAGFYWRLGMAVIRYKLRWGVKDRTPRCARCDYNLTGNVSGVCPECGSPVPETPSR